jgi:NAD(P)H-hydrate repair Nnr-like enzyme with NAD(P)H-hydrate epimerase domain
MQSLPVNIYSVASAQQIDRIAIEDHEVPGYTLMQRAGVATFRAARERSSSANRWQAVFGVGSPSIGDVLTSVIATLTAHGLILSKVATVGDELHARVTWLRLTVSAE